MEARIFLRLSKVQDLLSMLNSLKAIQSSVIITQKLILSLKNLGAFLLSSSSSRTIIGEGFIRNTEFDIYRLVAETEISIDFDVFRSVLKSLCKSNNSPTVTIEYPYRDNKLLLLCEDEAYSSHFYLDTYISEPQYNLELSGNLVAVIKFLDAKIIKQAMEVACHGKTDMGIFLSFSNSKPMFYFTRDDVVTGVKSKITVPFVEKVECKVSKDCEHTYSAKLLKNVANFPKCRDVEIKIHEEGVLEIEVSISADAWVRHFINPSEVQD